MVDVAQSGTLCIADPASVRLWRADAAKPATIRISGEGVQATASFRMGESVAPWPVAAPGQGRSAEHTSEVQSLMRISYAVFCWKKKNCSSPELAPKNTRHRVTSPAIY